MAALATLRRPIDDFFDHVTVNDPDAAKRERRLNLLNAVSRRRELRRRLLKDRGVGSVIASAAKQSSDAWIAASLTLLAMTSTRAGRPAAS